MVNAARLLTRRFVNDFIRGLVKDAEEKLWLTMPEHYSSRLDIDYPDMIMIRFPNILSITE